MQIGAMYPGHHIPGCRPEDLDVWIDAVTSSGLEHVVFGDHVLGVDPDVAPAGWNAEWPGLDKSAAYTYRNWFREPLTVLAYLAARTNLGLATGIVILPQRQTALFAKQAAEVDLLSRGRLRVGVGVGWNSTEFATLGVPFERRGARLEEQIALLRRWWTEPTVTFHGEFHDMVGVGVTGLPHQRPIPIWLGGSSPRARERAGRLADGCFLPPATSVGHGPEDAIPVLHAHAEAAGRDPATIGIEARLLLTPMSDDTIRETVERWRAIGVTHVSLDTQDRSLRTMTEHVDQLQRAASLVV